MRAVCLALPLLWAAFSGWGVSSAAAQALPAAPLPQGGEVVLGMSAAFTGPSRGLGIEYWRGAMAWLDRVNASGGVNGRTVRLLALDDGYQPQPCILNTIRLVEQEQVFALFSYIGTPTTTRMLPLLKKFEDRSLYLLFPFSGAEPLRAPPYGRYVFNLRASYFDETMGLVDHFVSIGRRRIAVFYQADAYGRNGWDGVKRALKVYGLSMCGDAAYHRGAGYDEDFSDDVRLLADCRPDAVITVGSYAACAAFIRDARNLGLETPIAMVSFSDADNILNLLLAEGHRAGRDYTRNLIFSQVVPSYEDVDLPGVRLYRDCMDAFTAMPPPELLREPYTPHRYSFVGFEGFLNARVLVAMLRAMDGDMRPARIPHTLESLGDLDLGIGVPARFGPDRHQGLRAVYYTTVSDGRIVPIRDWAEWRP